MAISSLDCPVKASYCLRVWAVVSSIISETDFTVTSWLAKASAVVVFSRATSITLRPYSEVPLVAVAYVFSSTSVASSVAHFIFSYVSLAWETLFSARSRNAVGISIFGSSKFGSSNFGTLKAAGLISDLVLKVVSVDSVIDTSGGAIVQRRTDLRPLPIRASLVQLACGRAPTPDDHSCTDGEPYSRSVSCHAIDDAARGKY